MFEFICSIPNWLGWTMVGALAVFNVTMIAKLVGCAVEYVKGCKEN